MKNRAERGREAVRDRRRCQVGRPASGVAAVIAASGQEGTLYPSALREPVDGPVLKDGNNLSKIGGQVLVGWLKGAKIVTLTLEERATCPRSCEMWLRCYGNSSPFTHRYRHGPELEAALEREVAELCEKHERVLVRLHVLGDFYSEPYIRLWEKLLRRHEGLFVFGFTAWGPEVRRDAGGASDERRRPVLDAALGPGRGVGQLHHRLADRAEDARGCRRVPGAAQRERGAERQALLLAGLRPEPAAHGAAPLLQGGSCKRAGAGGGKPRCEILPDGAGAPLRRGRSGGRGDQPRMKVEIDGGSVVFGYLLALMVHGDLSWWWLAAAVLLFLKPTSGWQWTPGQGWTWRRWE